ncbi:cellulose synthase-like protein G3 [Silene latifolia]|uniref:cellulose synthase-like protein G3 n=1 Tax=Silene latifolia TaxID=37657 RepID=UPI003D76FAF9
MENSNKMTTSTTPLHSQKPLRRAIVSRIYMAVYTVAILALVYRHVTHTLFNSPLSLNVLLILSDLILAFIWITTQPFHIRPIRRQEFLENLESFVRERAVELPAIDIFICTADPYKEPPMGTVNTALSVMAYDYPPEKLSIYVSDDGGSQVTLFAFLEAAKFARHWLPFCRDNHVMVRCPEAYFSDTSVNTSCLPEAHKLKSLYENMKNRVEKALDRGKIEFDDDEMRQVFAKWSDSFTPQIHPTVIQVLLNSGKDKDMKGQITPNLIYVSREKSKRYHHRFKAGALNALVRVSATMTNAPIVLTLDCDTYSNDPQTLKRALCYFLDPVIQPTLAYIQFPQIFRALNKADIYYSEHKRLFQIHPRGMDGLHGPNYVGTGCFFQRRAFLGPPSYVIQPKMGTFRPQHLVNNPIMSSQVLDSAYPVAASNYETKTLWGSKLGFRYGSLVEDYHTGYKMQCEGWKSVFCYPERPAFLGDSPITLLDLLGQCKRWTIGLLDVLCSKYSTLTYGIRRLGLAMGLCYTHYALWPIISIPLTIYAFIPQIALLNGISIFPKVSEAWFYLYIFLYIGANGKDLLDFILEKGTFERWWNSQRMWMLSGVSCFLFGCIEYVLTSLGFTVRGFDLTSKVQDDEQSKRYDQGCFEFGVVSPLFVPMTMAAFLNLVSFMMGMIGIYTGGMQRMEGLLLQILLSGFVVLNCWPFYEAMVFRSDIGRMPAKLSFIAAFLMSMLCIVVGAFLSM